MTAGLDVVPPKEADERKPLLERQGSGSGWSLSDAETLAGESGCSTPSSSLAAANEPWGPLMAIFAITAVQPLCFELIFPFVSTLQSAFCLGELITFDLSDQMILENGVVDDPEKVGFYTGFIESIFQVTGFFASKHLLGTWNAQRAELSCKSCRARGPLIAMEGGLSS